MADKALSEPGILTPQGRYDALITSRQLNPDMAQAEAISLLNSLYHNLSAVGWQALMPALTTPSVRRVLSRLFTRSGTPQQMPAGLYLYGGVGRGKTMMMDLFYQGLPCGTAQRFHFHDFMSSAHDAIAQARASASDDPIAEAAARLIAPGQVICFDEMEVRDIADAMIIKRLFDQLWNAGMVLVATSNRHPDDLYLNGLHRDRFIPFIDSLRTRQRIHHIADGDDWRLSRLSGMKSWHLVSEPATQTRLDELFSSFTSQQELKAVSIEVAGRTLIFDRVAGDVADVHFDQLCRTALGARDYLAVADRFSGLILRGIPSLGNAEQNEARRFMWLVDALYDRNRFMIASADAPLDTLYQGRQWAFEFDRTRSRLHQMADLRYVTQSDQQ